MIERHSNRLPRIFLLSSRLLLGLIASLLAVIPWSECYCALDNFPRGQDFETNLLAFLALLGLVLLLIELCHRGLSALLLLRRFISRLRLGCATASRCNFGFPATLSHRTPLPDLLSASRSLPLLI